MRDHIDLLATVTVLGVLEQAYFAMQVIYARRKYKIAPPETRGHPEFERTFRAQANCSEYFPIFISLLWVAGIFFHQGVTAACGLLYLYSRLKYFQGYTEAAQGRLGPLYASAWLLWLLLGLALSGLLAHFLELSSSSWMAALARTLQLHGAW
ncbi:leukotriene C4 synthase-like isoform X1 [Malurus melanocephalus]|uniref:leukotriene C4 synthase-like isoform X1 n=2 Tax=Malurus melanocephalus TaxID=175006 RepID=UPI0025488225|nr:leukotriene C4 synthase-like isoform X1 [Malurus melanocephalus]